MKSLVSFQQEVDSLRSDICRAIANIPRVSGDERRSEITKAQADIEEVEEIHSEMNLANDYSNNGWDAELEELEDEISQWKSQLQAASRQVNYDAQHSELIAGGSLLSAAVTADDHRKRMEHSTQLMNQGSEHVIQMNRIAQETIEMGAETMERLEQQGVQINESRSKLRDINASLDRANKTMRKIGRTLMTNKIFMVLGVIVVLVIIAVVIFLKFGLPLGGSDPSHGNECSDAVNLPVPSVASGSTASEPQGIISLDCFGYEDTASAIWYTITPPANTIVTISSCGSCFDTVLSVYSSNCDSLSCFVFNDDTLGSCESQCGFEFLSSSVSFCASADEYKILLRGYEGTAGDFKINVETGESCMRPSNDICNEAVDVPVLPQSFSYSTAFASGGINTCSGVYEEGHSVWYKVTGTGTTMVAHTCDAATNYETALAVFSGDCAALQCVAANRVNQLSCAQFGRSYVEWCSDIGEDYFVYVSGVDEFSFGSGVVSFEEGPAECEVGAQGVCTKPHTIEFENIFYFFTGSTILDSSNSVALPNCNTSPISINGIQWFSYRGAGNEIAIDTCDDVTDFDTVLQVFSGSCFGLECIRWNDDACGLQSEVSFCAQDGVDYLIAVGGYELDTGSFTLRIIDHGQCLQAPTCDTIEFSLQNDLYGDLNFIEPALLDTPSCSNSPLGLQNAWFLVYGSDSPISINTCDSCFDTVISVFESFSGCDKLRCVSFNDDHNGECSESFGDNECETNTFTSALSFCAGDNIPYFILVSGYAGDSGPFKLSILEDTENTCLYNDVCKFATPVVFGVEQIVDTYQGYIDYSISCNSYSDGSGSAWYMLQGTGNLISVELTSTAANVLVFSSEDGSCNSGAPQICIEADFIDKSSVEFCTKADQTYWVSIGNPDFGDYISFIFTEAGGCLDVENQICENREELNSDFVSHILLRGNTQLAGGETSLFSCGAVDFEPPSYSWYSIIGKGRTLRVSLCESNFDTVIGVFEASCNAKTCVASNDDSCDLQSSVEFCALTSIEYLIVIGGYDAASGDFSLLIEDTGICHNTDVCKGSEQLSIPTYITGSTVSVPSSVDIYYSRVPLDCIDGSNFVTTHWYSFVSIEAKMIDFAVTYSEMPIITGIYVSDCRVTSCASFIDHSYSGNYFQSVCGAYNSEIFLMVAGENDLRGYYEIDVSYSDTACSLSEQVSTCEDANVIDRFPQLIYGSTSGGKLFFDYNCAGEFYSSDGQSSLITGQTWYTFEGTGFEIEFNSCASSEFIKFVVFEDSCDSTECIASSDTSSCSLTWCSVPGRTYYVKMGKSSGIIGDYEITVSEVSVCVAPPLPPRVFTPEKSQTSITFTWDAPFSYGFEIIEYSFTLYDENISVVIGGTTTDMEVIIDSLNAGSVYYFIISATNEWGEGGSALFIEYTMFGTCSASPLEEFDLSLNNEVYFAGNLLIPNSHAIIHSVEIQVGQLNSGFLAVLLYESQYELGDFFEFIEITSVSVDISQNSHSNIIFPSLEWEICSNKRYYIAVYVDGEIYNAPNVESTTTCIGEMRGFTSEVLFLEVLRTAIWYDSELETDVQQMRIDADLMPASNTAPAAPVISSFYSTVDTITIEWREPCSISSITSYVLQINPQFQEIIIDPTVHEFTFTDLVADGLYNIQLVATNTHGSSESSEQLVQTLEDRFSIQWLSQSGSAKSVGKTVPVQVAIDSIGNSYTVGHFTDLCVFGDFTIEAQKFVTDGFLVKLDPQGNPLWLIHMGQGTYGETFCWDVVVDSSDNVYVTGQFTDNIILAEGAETIFTEFPGSTNAFVAKYSSDGDLLFSKHMGDEYGWSHEGYAITIDSVDRVIVTGSHDGFVDLYFYEDGFNLRGNPEEDTYYNTYVAVWSSEGVLLDATSIYGSDFFDIVIAHEISIDVNDNIYLVGFYDGNIAMENLHLSKEQNGGDNVYVIKLNSALEPQWLIGLGSDDGSINDGNTIKHDENSGFVVFAGYQETSGLTFYPADETLEAPYLISTIEEGAYMLALDSTNGSPIWLNTLSPILAYASFTSIDITDSGTIIASGYYSGALHFGAEYRGIPFPSTQTVTGFYAGINVLDGSLTWARWAGSLFHKQEGKGIDVRGETAIGVGYFSGSASFDCSSTVTTNEREAFITKLVHSADVIRDNEGEENFECGEGILTSEIGSIRFPMDPTQSYPNGFECQWLIRVENVPHIMAIVDQFNLADFDDSLIFYDGDSTNAPVLNYYNGETAIVTENEFLLYDNLYSRNEMMIQSTGNSLLIVFKSGACFRGTGFSLRYESAHEAAFCDNEFEQVLTLQSGLVSQRQKGGYKDSSNCFFYITPPSSEVILVDFVQFDLAADDFVEFIDETGTTSSILARFYGNDFTHPIQSLGNTLTVHFVSSAALYDKGFVIEYTGIDEPVYCIPQSILSEETGEIRSQSVQGGYLPNASCSWDIDVDEDLYDSVYIYFDQFLVPAPSSVYINRTTSTASNELIQVTQANVPFISHSSHLGIQFEAQGIIGEGFGGEYCAHPRDSLCVNEIFTNSTASFHNHFCGLYYESNSECEWTFAPEVTQPVRHFMITFPLVDFENTDPSNPTDYIDIKSGNREGPFLPIARLSGAKTQQTNPPTFITTQEALQVVFNSDSDGAGEGFNATACTSFVGSANECNGVNALSSPEGTFNNYFCGKIHSANAQCTWQVEQKNQPIASVMLVFNNLQFADEPWNGERWSDNLIVFEYSEPHTIYNRGGSHSGKIDPTQQENGAQIQNPEILSFSHPDVSVYFSSDDIGFTDGFTGGFCLFSTTDERLCSLGSEYFALDKTFDNHACGAYYQANADCSYIIKPDFPSNTKDIVLYIKSADFVNENNVKDFIRIYDTATINQENLLGEFSKSQEYYTQQAATQEASFPKAFIGSRDEMSILFKSDESGFGKGFEAEYCSVPKPASTCGGDSTITNHFGIIRDHSCGPTYYSPMDCSYIFTPSTQNFTYIAIVFNELDLGVGAVVEVYDPINDVLYSSADYLNNFEDGTRIIRGTALFIESSEAILRFIVDPDAELKSGWEIEYSTVTETGICSGESIYTESQGYVQDHVLGNFYENNQQCNFLVQIPGARAITVRFEEFQLEEGYDFLEIYDGAGWNAELIAFRSGNEIPEPFTTSSNSLYITFRTDFSVVRRGFKLFYSDADIVDCPLFCSGQGECINGACDCVSDRFGLGCEIFPPPTITEARFSNVLDSVVVSYERETNRAGMFGSSSNDCSILLESSSIDSLGFKPRCYWRDNKSFVIRMGNEASLHPGDLLSFKGDLIQDANPTEYHPIGSAREEQILPAREPVPPNTVIIGPTVLQTNRDLTLDASATYITGGRKPLFEWRVEKVCLEEGTASADCSLLGDQLREYVAFQHDEILFISKNYFRFYPSNARYYFTCTAVNFLGMKSAVARHVVNGAPTAVPMVVIAGPERYTIQRNEDLFIRSFVSITGDEFQQIADVDGCPDIQFSWTLTCLTGTCENQIIPLEQSETKLADIVIPAESVLLFDTSYKLTLELSYVEQIQLNTLVSHETVFIDVLPFQVDIEVQGGIQIVSMSDDLSLTAKLIDPQQELSNSVTYRWACRKESGYLCQKTNNDFLALEDSATVVIPRDTLPPGDYVFNVIGTFEDENLSSKDREKIFVRVLRREQPIVKILRSGSGKHDARKPLVLNSEVSGSVTSMQWSVTAGDLELDSRSIWSPTTTGNELVIAPNRLQDGATYRFRLEATATNNQNNFAEFEVVINESPSAGRLKVTPESGFSIDTKFTFSVSGASDDLSDMPLRYVFSVVPISCVGTELPNGKCPLIPISNSVEYPRFEALLPAGEYSPVVDVFDRIGSFRRVIAPFTITSFDTCPPTADLMTDYMKRIARIARAFDCLSDSDSVRQLVNIASVSLTCASFEIPDEALEVYFNELETLLNEIDAKTYSTEVFVDNQVKSFLLSSALPLNGRENDIGSLLRTSGEIATAAQNNGFLRDDSAQSLLGGLSNLLNDGIVASSDVSSVFDALNGISGGQLRERTCDTIVSDLSSSNIRMRNQRNSPSSLSGSSLSAPGSGGSFTLPGQIGGSECVNYVVVDFDTYSFNDGSSVLASLPSSLTFSDSNNSEIQLEISDPIEIRIPVPGSTNDQQYACASWNEETETWERDCTFIREENGFFVMETPHLTTFSVLLDGDTGGGGGGGVTITVSTFGSFASYFTGATEIFGESNLDDFGNLLSSFTALSEIPTEAFDTSNEVYDILQYSYSPAENEYGWTIDRILSLAFTGAALICIVVSIALLSIPAIRDRLSGKSDRTKRVMARAEARRRDELQSLNEATRTNQSSAI